MNASLYFTNLLNTSIMYVTNTLLTASIKINTVTKTNRLLRLVLTKLLLLKRNGIRTHLRILNFAETHYKVQSLITFVANIELKLCFQSVLYCSVLYCIKFFYNAQSLSLIFKYHV